MMPREITGRHVLFALLGAFGVVLAVNGAFLFLALSSYPGATERAFAQGLGHDAALGARAAQAALGWTTALDFDARSGALSFRAADALGRPVTGAAVTAELRRPVHAAADRSIVLSETAPGRYAAETGLAAGQWDLRLTLRRGAAAGYVVERRLWRR